MTKKRHTKQEAKLDFSDDRAEIIARLKELQVSSRINVTNKIQPQLEDKDIHAQSIDTRWSVFFSRVDGTTCEVAKTNKELTQACLKYAKSTASKTFAYAPGIKSFAQDVVSTLSQNLSYMKDLKKERANLTLTMAHGALIETGAIIMKCDAKTPADFLLLSDHVIICVAKDRLYTFYEDLPSEFLQTREQSSLLFVTGPSRTADIEQSLILGAHGAKAIHLIVLPENNTAS